MVSMPQNGTVLRVGMRFDCLGIFVDHKKCVLGSLWLQREKKLMGSHYYRPQFAMHRHRVQHIGLSPSLYLLPESCFSFRVLLLTSCTTWPFSHTSLSNWRSSSSAVLQTRHLQAKPSSRYESTRHNETRNAQWADMSFSQLSGIQVHTEDMCLLRDAPCALSLVKAHDCFKGMFWRLVNWWVILRNQALLPW